MTGAENAISLALLGLERTKGQSFVLKGIADYLLSVVAMSEHLDDSDNVDMELEKWLKSNEEAIRTDLPKMQDGHSVSQFLATVALALDEMGDLMRLYNRLKN